MDALGGSRFGGRGTWQSGKWSAAVVIRWSLGGSNPPQCPPGGSNGAPQRSFCKEGTKPHTPGSLGPPPRGDGASNLTGASPPLSSPPLPALLASGCLEMLGRSCAGEQIGASPVYGVSPSPDRPPPVAAPGADAHRSGCRIADGRGSQRAGHLCLRCRGASMPTILPWLPRVVLERKGSRRPRTDAQFVPSLQEAIHWCQHGP